MGGIRAVIVTICGKAAAGLTVRGAPVPKPEVVVPSFQGGRRAGCACRQRARQGSLQGPPPGRRRMARRRRCAAAAACTGPKLYPHGPGSPHSLQERWTRLDSAREASCPASGAPAPGTAAPPASSPIHKRMARTVTRARGQLGERGMAAAGSQLPPAQGGALTMLSACKAPASRIEAWEGGCKPGLHARPDAHVAFDTQDLPCTGVGQAAGIEFDRGRHLGRLSQGLMDPRHSQPELLHSLLLRLQPGR